MPPTNSGDQVDAPRIHTHQWHDLAVLRDRADRGAGISASQEQVHQHHASQRAVPHASNPGVAEKHAGDLQHRQADAEIAEVDAECDGGEALQEEQHTAGGVFWLIGAAPSSGAMTRMCSRTPSPPTPAMQIAASSTNGR